MSQPRPDGNDKTARTGNPDRTGRTDSIGPPADGVIKYQAEHSFAPLPTAPDFLALLEKLDAARTLLHSVGLIGVDAQGTGYGNLSARLSPAFSDGSPDFLISGSGTGKAPVLGAGGYCRVLACAAEANRVISSGPVRASSESMSHDAVYRANGAVRFVIHVHHQGLFAALLREGWPHTPSSVAYGTPEMAQAVCSLVESTPHDEGLFVSAGHAEGLFAYGTDLERVVREVMRVFRHYTGKESRNNAGDGEGQ